MGSAGSHTRAAVRYEGRYGASSRPTTLPLARPTAQTLWSGSITAPVTWPRALNRTSPAASAPSSTRRVSRTCARRRRRCVTAHQNHAGGEATHLILRGDQEVKVLPAEVHVHGAGAQPQPAAEVAADAEHVHAIGAGDVGERDRQVAAAP